MRMWVMVCGLATAAALGCAADTSPDGMRGPIGSSGVGGGGAGTGGSGAAGLNVGMPMPTAGTGVIPPPPTTDGGGECGAVSQTAQNMLQPVDIIIGVDTSGSMGEEIAFVQEHLNAFSQQIIDSGVDVRVILIAAESAGSSGDTCIEIIPGLPCVDLGGLGGFGVCIGPPLGSGACPADSNAPAYTHVNHEISSNDILNKFISTYPSYAPQLRENSLKTFVAITDDDATDGPYDSADAFIQAVAALDPNPSMWANWRYAGIYCFTECPAAAEIGTVHADLVSRTGGVGGDLCLQDFAPVFDELAQQVVDAVTLACDWAIPAPPGDETFDAAKTNLRLRLDGGDEALLKADGANGCGDQDGWHYDDEVAPTRVVACPATCNRIQAAQQASVDILFGCETVTIVPE